MTGASRPRGGGRDGQGDLALDAAPAAPAAPAAAARFASIDGLRGLRADGVLQHHAAIRYFYRGSGVWEAPASPPYREVDPGAVALFGGALRPAQRIGVPPVTA